MTDDRSWLGLFVSALARHASSLNTFGTADTSAESAVAGGIAVGTPAAGPAPAPLRMPGNGPVIRIAPTLPRRVAMAASLTPELLQRLGARDPDLWAPSLAAACADHGVDTPHRMAAFLANVMVETGRLSSIVESLNYTPQALLRQWPRRFTPEMAQRLGRTASHPADQRGIAEIAYGGRMGNGPAGSGDGWTFRGRGLIQLTGRESYGKFAGSIGMNLPDLPAYLETRDGAANSAAFYWQTRNCNDPADAGNIAACRRIVNGGEIGLPEVRQCYATACTAFGIN